MSSILIEVLLNPRLALTLNPSQYQEMISQGRGTGLLGALANLLRQSGTLEELPYRIKRHIDSAWVVYTKTTQDIAYEISWLKRAMASSGERLILLKGAAYIQADLASSIGRTLSDIDILAPEQSIQKVENSLNAFGWKGSKQDSYDDRYYRKWMHEIPPLVHSRRGSVLDLHHTILPPTAAPNVDARLLFENLVEVKPGVFTLPPCAMVIHSATHLFHEGEFHNALRDLWDLDRMLRDFSERNPQFWEDLVNSARKLDLLGSLFHGLSYSQQVFETPIPSAVIGQTSNWARRFRKPLMDFLFRRAFQPNHPECKLPLTGIALSVLYVRSHYLRMPLHLLIPHLARKAWMSRFGKADQPEDVAVAAE